MCDKGYGATDRRDPQQHGATGRCARTSAAPTGARTSRGAEKAPSGRTGAAYRSPVATYDAGTGKVTWADQDTSAKIAYDGGAAQLFGDDTWKWMLLQPSLADNQE